MENEIQKFISGSVVLDDSTAECTEELVSGLLICPTCKKITTKTEAETRVIATGRCGHCYIKNDCIEELAPILMECRFFG